MCVCVRACVRVCERERDKTGAYPENVHVVFCSNK